MSDETKETVISSIGTIDEIYATLDVIEELSDISYNSTVGVGLVYLHLARQSFTELIEPAPATESGDVAK